VRYLFVAEFVNSYEVQLVKTPGKKISGEACLGVGQSRNLRMKSLVKQRCVLELLPQHKFLCHLLCLLPPILPCRFIQFWVWLFNT
jgi:hypothetical protein